MPSALHGGDGPSPAVHTPPPGLADQNDLSQSQPTFAFILNQLSYLLTSLGSTATDAYTRQQLLGAMCNMLMASLTLPYSPASSIPAAAAAAPLPNSPAVSAAPAPSVASPVIEPPRPRTSPPRPTSSPPAPSTPPPGPAPILAIRVLTPIEQLRPPPLRSHTRRSLLPFLAGVLIIALDLGHGCRRHLQPLRTARAARLWSRGAGQWR
jgi:hypothetical protein